jgi:hypothetical protein
MASTFTTYFAFGTTRYDWPAQENSSSRPETAFYQRLLPWKQRVLPWNPQELAQARFSGFDVANGTTTPMP